MEEFIPLLPDQSMVAEYHGGEIWALTSWLTKILRWWRKDLSLVCFELRGSIFIDKGTVVFHGMWWNTFTTCSIPFKIAPTCMRCRTVKNVWKFCWWKIKCLPSFAYTIKQIQHNFIFQHNLLNLYSPQPKGGFG